MAEEEHKEQQEHHEEHKEGDHKGSAKQKKLLYWGLGLAGAGLLISLLIYNKGGQQAATDQTVANPSTPFVPNPTDASQNEYWPVLQSNPATGQITGTSGSTSSSSGSSSSSSGSKKKSSSSSKKSTSSSSSSKKSTSSSTKKTSVTPNPTAGGAHGWVYTAKGGETLNQLATKAWPSNPNLIFSYANNKALFKSEGITSSKALKKGQKVVL